LSSGHKGQQGINNGQSLLSIVRRDKQGTQSWSDWRVYLLLAKPSGLALHSGKVYHQRMNQLSRFVSLHPYFKVPSDKMAYLKAILPEFVAKTRNETGNLFYEFTINSDEVFCREG
jgi:hypothetical protein